MGSRSWTFLNCRLGCWGLSRNRRYAFRASSLSSGDSSRYAAQSAASCATSQFLGPVGSCGRQRRRPTLRPRACSAHPARPRTGGSNALHHGVLPAASSRPDPALRAARWRVSRSPHQAFGSSREYTERRRRGPNPAAPAGLVSAMNNEPQISFGPCCFCAKPITPSPTDPCSITVETQAQLWQVWQCHALCFKSRLASIPDAPDLFEPAHF